MTKQELQKVEQILEDLKQDIELFSDPNWFGTEDAYDVSISAIEEAKRIIKKELAK